MKQLKLLGLWAVCVVSSMLILLIMLCKVFTNPERSVIIATALDRAGNASINGNPLETISSRAYRATLEGRRWGCFICKVLDRFDKDHCKKYGEKKS